MKTLCIIAMILCKLRRHYLNKAHASPHLTWPSLSQSSWPSITPPLHYPISSHLQPASQVYTQRLITDSRPGPLWQGPISSSTARLSGRPSAWEKTKWSEVRWGDVWWCEVHQSLHTIERWKLEHPEIETFWRWNALTEMAWNWNRPWDWNALKQSSVGERPWGSNGLILTRLESFDNGASLS